MPPEEQQTQPVAPEQGNVSAPQSAEGSSAESTQQTPFQRVSPEEAATLPYPELKRRMREEARLQADGQLPEPVGDDHDEDEGEAGTAGQDSTRAQGSGGEGGGTTRQSDPELQSLLTQAQARAAQLERERAQERQQLESAAQQAQLQAQHQRVEQAIANLPEQQQELARRDYMNRLGRQALNDYHGFLTQREQAIRQAEIGQVRNTLPSMLAELADAVAQRHGLRNADPLKQYVQSKEFKQLLEASQTEDALTAAAANAGQWMEFLAVQQAAQNTQARESRRQNAAANPRVVRDTPPGGVPTAGGDMDLVRRINTMSKEEFFAWKKQQLREANSRA